MQIAYSLPLSAASVAALNEHRRFLFLYNFKIICVNITVIQVLYPWNSSFGYEAIQFQSLFYYAVRP